MCFPSKAAAEVFAAIEAIGYGGKKASFSMYDEFCEHVGVWWEADHSIGECEVLALVSRWFRR